MRILFDQGTPFPLRRGLEDHEVETVFRLGWSRYKNGLLLRQAEEAGYNVFVTTDQKLKYQQQVTNRKLAIVVILTTSWPKIQPFIAELCAIITRAEVGAYIEFPIPE